MKTGIVSVEAIHIACPECGEPVAAPNGAQNITEVEYEALPATLTCDGCGRAFRTPKVTWSRGARR